MREIRKKVVLIKNKDSIHFHLLAYLRDQNITLATTTTTTANATITTITTNYYY